LSFLHHENRRLRLAARSAAQPVAPIAPSAIRRLAEHTTEHVRARLPKIYSREPVDVIFEQPYCRIANLVDKGIAQRQAASRYLHDLADLGVLREMPVGKEKLFIHPKLMELIGRDDHVFEPYG
jgi:Fic family protein